MPDRITHDVVPEFSLTSGGALYNLLVRLRLTRRPMEFLMRRVVVITLAAWLPLLILSVQNGMATGGVEVPFLRDVATHVRFLIALPLFLWAEVTVHYGMQPVIAQFLVRRIVPHEAEDRFRSLILSTIRWRDSLLTELVLLALVIVIGQFVTDRTALQTSTWYSTATATGSSDTPAGLWYAWFSMPLFQFIMLRWFFRWLLWVVFLWRVTRLPLALIPTHPDRAAGLAFLSRAVVAYSPVLTALSSIIGGVVAGKILYEGVTLQSFLFEGIVAVLLLLVIGLGPLCVFMPRLALTRRRGEFEYGTLATHYVAAFNQKWNNPAAADDKELLGSADIQSLADLSNSYGIVDGMRTVPFDRNALVLTVACAIIPLAPLVLFIIPLDELLIKVLGIIF